MHLFSESAVWETKSEFVTEDGTISKGYGETRIYFEDHLIFNQSWVKLENALRENHYKINPVSENLFEFESLNPELGIQKGKFHIDRNVVFSKFEIPETELAGFEIIIRSEDKCYSYGSLYRGDHFINSWSAILRKKSR